MARENFISSKKKFFIDILLIFLLAFVLTLLSILFVDQVVDLTLIKALLTHKIIFIMNYIPIFIFLLIGYFLTGSLGLSFCINSTILFLMGIGNQNKLFYRNDNLRLTDLGLIKEGLSMLAEGNPLKVHKIYFVYPIFIILGSFLLIKFLKTKMPKALRLGGLVFSLVLGGLILNTIMIDRDTYWNNSMGRYHPYIEVERAKDRGLVYTFTYAYRDLFNHPPENYQPEEAKKILASYKESMPEDKDKVDIILILGESYGDLESLGAKVDPEVYKPFKELREKSLYGKIQNYTFGGGTIETERNILTGAYSNIPYIKNRNSLVWMLKDQGYISHTMHPFTGAFYNRLNTNKFLGLDNFLYSENFFDQYYVNKPGKYFPDDLLFPLILENYDQRAKDHPYFNFVVTMQNHTPYSQEDHGIEDYLDRETFKGSDGDYNSANNYLYGIKNTGENLLKLTQELEKRKEPVVVIFFGDHLARLGGEGELYKMMGIDIGLDSLDGWLNHYTTPYIFWASSEAQKHLADEIKGQGPYMSNYYLFAYCLNKLGFKSSYVKYLNDILEEMPIDASSYTSENGSLTANPKEETLLNKNRFKNVEYYYKTNFFY